MINYGLTLNKDVVLDLYNYPAMVPSKTGRYILPFPAWIKVGESQLNKDLPDYLKDIGALGFTIASSIDIEEKEGIEYKVIAKSSGKSWSKTGMTILDPQQIEEPKESDLNVFNLAVLATGRFKSIFTKDKLPQGANIETFTESGSNEGAFLLISSPEFILDQTMQRFRSNGLFFINIIDYLSNNKELAGIRSRNQGYNFIDPSISDSAKTFLKWFGTLFIPILVTVYGFFRMMIRNKKSGRK